MSCVKQNRFERRSLYLFTCQIRSTVLWHCEVAFSSDLSIKNDCGLRRKQIFDELSKNDCELEEVFVEKFEAFLTEKKNTFGSSRTVVEDDFAMSTPARKPSRMMSNPRVCAAAARELVITLR